VMTQWSADFHLKRCESTNICILQLSKAQLPCVPRKDCCKFSRVSHVHKQDRNVIEFTSLF
jgi:hypothetical protein